MIQVKNPKNCCGCTACMSICPKQAISMKPDILGFLYPEVDLNACVDCGLCEKVCSFNDWYDKSENYQEPLAFGARHRDIKEVESSRSGAAFIAFSDWVLQQGGVVYGAGFVDHFRVAHKRATTKTERDEFKGSKYVQSDLGTTFKQVKEDLKNGLLVMFSGTACQIAGLKSFVGKKLRPNLYLIDIVCHGAPSPFIWRDYLASVELKYGCAEKVNFRDKSRLGWGSHKESFTFENGMYLENYIYTDLFYQHVMFRHSCSVCHFTNLQHPSDITIADFWGWEKTNQTINSDNKGVSLFFINNEKGKFLFESVKDNLVHFPVELKNCMQPNLQHPSSIHPLRMKFEEDYARKSFDYVSYRYSNRYFWTKLKKKCKKIAAKIFPRTEKDVV